MFDKTKAEKHFNQLLKQYGIKVTKWSVTSCGYAYWDKKEIKVPHPTNPDRFCVCMHEIKHIIDGDSGKRYEQEFYADKYATEQAEFLGFDTTEWKKRMTCHCLSRIAMAHNRKFNLNNLNPEIREFFYNVDFESWKEHKVFVHWSSRAKNGFEKYQYYITLSE